MKIGKTLASALGAAILLATVCVGDLNASRTVCDSLRGVLLAEGDDGKRALSLSASDFQVTVGGQAARVIKAERPPQKRRITFLIHMSGNLHTASAIQTSLSLAANLVILSPDGTQFALVSFNDDPYRDLNFTDDKTAVISQLHVLDDASKWRGASGLFDAIEFSLSTSVPRVPGDCIVLISNGSDNTSRSTLEHALRMIADSGVSVFAIEVPMEDLVSATHRGSRSGQENLDQIAAVSAGEWFHFGDVLLAGSHALNLPLQLHHNLDNVRELSTTILDEMNGYQFYLAQPARTRIPAKWHVELNGSAAQSIKLRYPDKLYSCTVTASH